MKTEIIVIGDELLIGQVIDTNSKWMAAELNKQGWEVTRITTISDGAEDIKEAISSAFSRVDTILMTGGLGPTSDDVTKPVLCEYFGGRMIFDEMVYEQNLRYFAGRGLQMNQSTRRQAEVPDVCTVIPNPVGTAPIMWFEQEGKVLVAMPGVPHEMRVAMKGDVLERLRRHYGDNDAILHRTLMVFRNTESGLSERLTDFEAALPPFVKLAYLPIPGVVRLRLTARGNDEDLLQKTLDEMVEKLRTILGDDIFCDEDMTLAGALGKMLKNRGLSIATAESCTGGNIAHEITAISGSSAYFNGSVVAYSNEVKESLLGVPADVLAQHGAVSKEVVEAMATGVKQALNVDCAIATSGIAGPDGGTPEKPVGTVWMAVCCGGVVVSECGHFAGSRAYIIERATQRAIMMLIDMLCGRSGK
ncbi:MAG: competence/damage-inducible protein A [Bacteroidaceae bacterium]|nr:competence/damage-inducible protein A [Bacteroidaceae bacterium]